MATPEAHNWTDSAAAWPPLPLEEWKDTCETLHMWTQIVGQVRLKLTPLVNHFWNCTLYVTPRGLTTSAIPYGSGIFEMRFDFLANALVIDLSDGTPRRVQLAPRTVSDFYGDVMNTLHGLGIQVKIVETPQEVPEADKIPFPDDTTHKSYDAAYVLRFWRALAAAETVFEEFRAGFVGKCSPVHFFWGSFDLAVSRFSGRRATLKPDADYITREAYPYENSSVGFWPGSGNVKEAAFYAYAWPEPEGYKRASVRPAGAYYDAGGLDMFLLPYEAVRSADNPRTALLEFAQNAYEAQADLAHWDREALERPKGG